MAIVSRYLVDTSAAARMEQQQVAARLVPLIGAGLVGTCAALDYEALFSARTPQEYEQVRADRRDAYEYLPTLDEDWQRVVEVQGVLASTSRLRAVGLPDFLVAAVAEREAVTVVHYDADFDVVGEITGQEMMWVVPRGSVP